MTMILNQGEPIVGVVPPSEDERMDLERWIEDDDVEEEALGRLIPMMDPEVIRGALEWGQLQAEESGVEATAGAEEFCSQCTSSHMRGANAGSESNGQCQRGPPFLQPGIVGRRPDRDPTAQVEKRGQEAVEASSDGQTAVSRVSGVDDVAVGIRLSVLAMV
jgi:hypothetical protein